VGSSRGSFLGGRPARASRETLVSCSFSRLFVHYLVLIHHPRETSMIANKLSRRALGASIILCFTILAGRLVSFGSLSASVLQKLSRRTVANSRLNRWNRIAKEDILKYKHELDTKGYTVVPQILSSRGIDELNVNVRFGENEGALQGWRRHSTKESSPTVASFHEDVAFIFRHVLGDVKNSTYSFALEYDEHSFLPPHLELVYNEISMTLCYFRDNESDLFIDKYWQENKYAERFTAAEDEMPPNGRVERMRLRAGDIGIFNGRNHLHWRDKFATALTWRGILFHFMRDYTAEELVKQTSWGIPDEKHGLSNTRYNKDFTGGTIK
tara:strand:+ start:158 stop:1135 length:978 start_codon:yes stop_codon:yes gene_type:complete